MIDWTRPIETVDGKPARVLCTDAKSIGPVIILVDNGNVENVYRIYPNGEIHSGEPFVRNKPLVDWSKPIQTRSGYPARVLCTNLKSNRNYPIVLGVTDHDGGERALQYTIDGFVFDCFHTDPYNIVNVGAFHD